MERSVGYITCADEDRPLRSVNQLTLTTATFQLMQTHTIESVDERLVNLTRLVLALSALIIIVVDPAEPDRFVKITYTALALYTVYSAYVYFLSRTRQSTNVTLSEGGSISRQKSGTLAIQM